MENKDWWTSRTIWTQIIGMGVTVAGVFGLNLSGMEATIVTLVMGVITIVLRFVTVKPIAQSAAGKP